MPEEITAQSVDMPANGYQRRRFMLALLASLIVLFAIGTLGFDIRDMSHAWPKFWPSQWYLIPLGLLVGVPLTLLPMFVVVTLVSVVVDLLPPRLIGFLLLAVFTVGAVAGGTIMLGVLPLSDKPKATWLEVAPIIVVMGLGVLVSVEGAIHGFWQFTVDRPGFLAVRGWRPPLHHLLATFRRRIGLPPFLAGIARGRSRLTLLYLLVAILNTATAASLILPFALNGKLNITDIVVYGALLLLVVLNVAGAGRLVQAMADRRATGMYQAVREWDARKPVLFLRSFDQDKLKVQAPSADRFLKLQAGIGRQRNLDELLLEHASPYGPVIAIGDPRDPTPPLGAARIFVADHGADWRTVVGELVDASRAIVMSPTATEGVRWELELLDRTGANARTIFLASPSMSDADITAILIHRTPITTITMSAGQHLIAAFPDPVQGWRVLSARTRSVQSYTVALNLALQALFGMQG